MAQESWKIEKDESNCEILKPPSSSSSSPSPSSSLPSSSPPPPPPPSASSSSPSPSPSPSSSSTAAAAAAVATTITAAATIPLLLKHPHEFPIQRSEMGEAPDTGDSGAIVSVIRKLDDASPRPVRFANRCSSCQKRVGLTGFRCRCGDLFCSQHRYSDTHDCSFDYKAAGREAISKANPVIRAAKIIRI